MSLDFLEEISLYLIGIHTTGKKLNLKNKWQKTGLLSLLKMRARNKYILLYKFVD